MSGGRAGGADPRRGWTGEELAASGEHRQHLSAERVRRLARELPTDLGAADLETVGAVRAALVEPLGDVAAELRDRLGPEGLGIAVVTGDGLDALGDARSATLLWGLTVLLGRPMVQNAEDELLVSVRDARPSDVHTARGYLSNGGMLMHTDPSDVAALLCIEASADGGTSLFSSAPAVRAVLRREAPHLWDEYHRIWTWDLRGMQEPSTDPYVTTPIFCDHEGRLACRYGALMLREGEGSTGPLRPEAAEALDRFEEVAKRPTLTLRHRLRRGESVWFDNYRTLHGREGFVDRDETRQVRHLLRTWLWLEPAPDLAPELLPFSRAMDWRDRRGLGHSR